MGLDLQGDFFALFGLSPAFGLDLSNLEHAYREVQGRFGEELCKARISENVSLAESPASNEDVFAHAPSSRGAQDYDALLDELIETGFLK